MISGVIFGVIFGLIFLVAALGSADIPSVPP
jgi:hypothetical protein